MSADPCLCGNDRKPGSILCGVCKHASLETRLKRWAKASKGDELARVLPRTDHVEPSPEPPPGLGCSPYGPEEWA